ncbi:hypothetical protein CMO96_03650 [Candidatus Woesebacteria bacterium]|nr:hypothetical protein [Candidatus Woesebacteria bacterium]|tara:strand:- start:269 stop:547 length:279 start_codon:yes stop_codon:yes gene_type:complete
MVLQGCNWKQVLKWVMAYEPIVTNNAYTKMRQWGVTKNELMGAFYSSMKEQGKISGSTVGIARMGGYEIGAMYLKDSKGQWIIISCWKRKYY